MRKLLAGLGFFLVLSVAHGGAYDEILEAAERGDSVAVVALLQRGMDVNTTDQAGNSLLMIAARNGNVELLEFLLKSRAGVNRRNRFGDTAMLLAVVNGNLDAVKALKQHGGQLDPGGWSALHYAVFGENPDLLAWLLAQKPGLDARAPNGQTALMLASKMGKLEFVKQLIDGDADMDLADYEGVTAIALAKRGGFDAIVAYLRSVGAVE
jgi:ankyrin repeat protein